MQNLYRNFRLQLELASTDFIRFLHDKIAWDSRLIAIVGSRGVGKTTLLLQHIKKYEKPEDVLYITADDFYFTNHRLFDLAYQFYTQGGKKLFIDEIHKYKELLYALAQSVPFKPNYTKLERDLEISRNTLPDYLLYLEKAGLINLLREKANGIKVLEKIGKIYLSNTDIAYILSDTPPDIGNIRETVFFTWMRVGHFITSSPISDFEIDGLTFEVGGRNKKKAQIKNAVEGYIVKDDMEYAYQNKIPLWMFGFIY